MSFVTINAEDFVISADSITSTLWSDNTTTLVNFYTSSTSITNKCASKQSGETE